MEFQCHTLASMASSSSSSSSLKYFVHTDELLMLAVDRAFKSLIRMLKKLSQCKLLNNKTTQSRR